MPTIEGRLPAPRKPRFTATLDVFEGEVLIRVDDRKSEEFWLTVHLTRDEMEKLFNAWQREQRDQ